DDGIRDFHVTGVQTCALPICFGSGTFRLFHCCEFMNIVSNGLRFEVVDTGPVGAPVVLLTMGLGMQLVDWPDSLLQALAQAGFRSEERRVGKEWRRWWVRTR